jgi:hypothetical protein
MWTQMICALLILQEPELPLPLDTFSPWLDMVSRAAAARAASGATSSTTPISPGTPRLQALASDNLVEWVHREPIDRDPVRAYTRTTQS